MMQVQVKLRTKFRPSHKYYRSNLTEPGSLVQSSQDPTSVLPNWVCPIGLKPNTTQQQQLFSFVNQFLFLILISLSLVRVFLSTEAL